MKKSIAIILCLLMLLPLGCELRKETITPSSGPELVEPSKPDEPASDPEPEKPVEPAAPQGQGDLVFDTVTLYGEPISSDMIKDYDLVLVNFWADWCGWCVYEMPELERIHQEYPNVLILGVLSFPNSMDDSLQILQENNITFLTLEPAGTLVETANGLMAFPTTLFFDRNGNAVGDPIEGAQDYDGWKATVDGLLAGLGQSASAPSEPAAPQGQGDLVFDTVTLYGEPISSDMIKDYDLVLVNFWADWCGWCVYEMPELERIHQEYPNVLILGVLSFPNSMDDSLQILQENNITFLTLEPNGTLVDMANGLEAFPTTYFFDRNGNSIGEPVVGAQDYDGWKATVEGLLP